MKIKFYFTEPKNEKSPMMISVAWSGKRRQTSIGITQKTSTFDSENQKFRKSATGYAQINNYLDKLKLAINDFYYNSIATNTVISEKEMKLFLNSIIKEKGNGFGDTSNSIREVTISYLLDRFIEGIDNNPLYKKSSIRRYKNFETIIRKYITKHYDIKFENLDYDYIRNFALFLSNELNFADATIQKSLKTLSLILNRAFESEIISKQSYKPLFTKLFKELKLKTASQKFALNTDDIKKIENYTPDNEKLKYVKDMFLFEIYTAQRISDLFKTHKSAIDLKEKTLNIRQVKTNELVSIPLIDKAIAIIKKYPDMTFPYMSKQFYNRMIKVVAKNAGLDDLIQIDSKSLNKIEKSVKQKWELVASHHARVTCIVNMAQNGALPEEIIMVSGHSAPRSIEPYMRISSNEKKKRSRQALERAFGWYFMLKISPYVRSFNSNTWDGINYCVRT